MSPLFKGVLIGFSIAAPVGPIGILCIRRSIKQGRLAGFVSGLGAAAADTIYGAVAALGLTAVMNLLLQHTLWLQLGGGCFLLCMGVAMWRAAAPKETAEARPPLSLWAAFGSTLLLTLTNPMTVVAFVGIFAGLGFHPGAGSLDGLWLVVGVFAGSALWWLILSSCAAWLGARVSGGRLHFLNVVAGVVIAGFGLWQIGMALWKTGLLSLT